MPADFDPLEGGCTCGQVRYRVTSEPLIVHACHCRWCQRETGGPHVVNALYEATRIECVEGAVESTRVPSESGAGQVIARCPICRIAIWSNYQFGGMWERVRFLRVGTLDDPDLMPPDIHIFTAGKMPWYVLPEGQHAVEKYYDPRMVWSESSQERYRTLKKALE